MKTILEYLKINNIKNKNKKFFIERPIPGEEAIDKYGDEWIIVDYSDLMNQVATDKLINKYDSSGFFSRWYVDTFDIKDFEKEYDEGSLWCVAVKLKKPVKGKPVYAVWLWHPDEMYYKKDK